MRVSRASVGARVRAFWGGWALLLLFLSSACATPGRPAARARIITLAPRSDFAPVQISDTEFREAFTQLLLEVPLEVRGEGRLLRASWHSEEGGVDTVERGYARLCERRGTPGDCLSFLDAGLHGASLSGRNRFTLGLLLALAPAMEASVGALRDFSTNAMTVLLSGLSLYLLVLMAPEPISKGIALAMTVFLWSYLGMELWDLVSATRRLWSEAKSASTFSELSDASVRYGQVLGPNTVRVLLLLATWKAGAKGREAMTGTGLPGMPQAAENAVASGGFRLSAAAAEAESVSVLEEGLSLSLPSSSGALLVMQMQGTEQEGDIHHIATVENEKSTLRGGPWTQQFKKLFDKAGMSMEDAANKVRVRGHKGPHSQAYHEEVFDRLRSATESCRTTAQCREALTRQLKRLADELQRESSRLNKWITRNP